MGDMVSASVGMSIALVIVLPSSRTQCSRYMVRLTENFFNNDLKRVEALTAGACLGMPNSTETLISWVSSGSSTMGCWVAGVSTVAQTDFLIYMGRQDFFFCRWGFDVWVVEDRWIP